MNTMNIPYAERLWYTLRQHGYEVSVQEGGYAAYVGAPNSPAVCIMDGDGNYQLCRCPEIGRVEQLCMMEGIQNIYRMVKNSALNPLHLPGLDALDVETEGNFCDGRQSMMHHHCPMDSAEPNLYGLPLHEEMEGLISLLRLLGQLFGAPLPIVLARSPDTDKDDDEDSSHDSSSISEN